jgi:hypothetical protein
MTILQDTALAGTSGDSPPSRVVDKPASEPRARVAGLSPAKRHALVACLNASGLSKKNGAWHGAPGAKPVSGVTVADLARDGLLTVSIDHRIGSARLTERGNWFARTLLEQDAATLSLSPLGERVDRAFARSG